MRNGIVLIHGAKLGRVHSLFESLRVHGFTLSFSVCLLIRIFLMRRAPGKRVFSQPSDWCRSSRQALGYPSAKIITIIIICVPKDEKRKLHSRGNDESRVVSFDNCRDTVPPWFNAAAIP